MKYVLLEDNLVIDFITRMLSYDDLKSFKEGNIYIHEDDNKQEEPCSDKDERNNSLYMIT